MTTDIVERLRGEYGDGIRHKSSAIKLEAADEIKRLTGLLAEWENHAGPYKDAEIERLTEERGNAMTDEGIRTGPTASDLELDRLRAEIERLRAALQSLTKDPPPTLDEPDTDAEVIIKMRETALRALEQKP